MYSKRTMYGSEQTGVWTRRSILPKEGSFWGERVAETNKPMQPKLYFMADPNASGGRNRSGVRITRCPYCVEGGDFKVMTEVDSRYHHRCGRCGHVTMLSDPLFKCTCAKCAGLRLF